MAKYKKCPGCGIDLKPAAPVCYVCQRPQPGFENATSVDQERFDEALARKDALPDRSKVMLIVITVGWLTVLFLLVFVLLANQSLLGPGGPR